MPARAYLQYDKIITVFGDMCIKFVNDHRRICKYHITDCKDMGNVLQALIQSINIKNLNIIYHNSLHIAVEVYDAVIIYVFLTETDADTLLVTVSTNKNIVP